MAELFMIPGGETRRSARMVSDRLSSDCLEDQPDIIGLFCGMKKQPSFYTDGGQAEVYSKVYADQLKYCKEIGFLHYNGKVWIPDDLKAQELALKLTTDQIEEAAEGIQSLTSQAQARGPNKEEIRSKILALDKYQSYAIKRQDASKIAATLTLAKSNEAIAIKAENLDKDCFLLNTPGGIVDLHSGILSPNRPEAYCTKLTAVAPDDNGREIYKSFLEAITCGDKELENYLQIIAGSFLIGKVYLEKLFIAYGTGGNGKSTFFNLLARVMGTYAGKLSAESLISNNNQKNYETAGLRGMRFVIASELPEWARLDTAAMKHLSSTDPIKAEQKYKDPIVFTPSHSLVLYTNHIPKVGATDGGTWRRIVLIPFLAEFCGKQNEVMNYTETLFSKCGGAVLQWMIDGAKQFIENGYKIEPPDCVKHAIEEYRKDNDWMADFLEARCDISPSFTQAAGELYTEYRNYSVREGEFARSKQEFKRELESRKFQWKKTKTGAVYIGLKLNYGYPVTDNRTPFDGLNTNG